MYFLEADMSVKCFVGEHSDAMSWAVFCIFVYVIGIPLWMFYMLSSNREYIAQINDDNDMNIDLMFTNAALILLVILQLKTCMGFVPDATCNRSRKARYQQHLTNAKNLYSTSSSQNESTSSTRPKKKKGPKITPKRE